jgi:hypothetical protein
MTDAAPWRALGCAILLQSIKDARADNAYSAEARDFLESDSAADLLLRLGFDPAGLARVVRELPELPGMG